MTTLLEERQVRRAYKLYSPVYDLLFDWIFKPGRARAVELLGIEPGDRVLEVGVGTGLNLPAYSRGCEVTGIDLSAEMLDKAHARVAQQALEHVTLRVMDASAMDFPDGVFDRALAAYTISAVPSPRAVLREMRRVVKPGGVIVILNHFRSANRAFGWIEDRLEPLCRPLGWSSNLRLGPLLQDVGLAPEVVEKVNLFHGWRIVRCRNGEAAAGGASQAAASR